MIKAFMNTNKLFYVRGLVCETRKTVVLLAARDEMDAALKAGDFGITGEVVVIPEEEWDGRQQDEHFFIGFVQ